MSLSGPFINQEITTTNPVVGHDSRWNSNKRKFSEVRIFSSHVWVPQINSLYKDLVIQDAVALIKLLFLEKILRISNGKISGWKR
jgi:hypothetical protein